MKRLTVYTRLKGQSRSYEIHSTGRPRLRICDSSGNINRLFRGSLPLLNSPRKVVTVERQSLQQVEKVDCTTHEQLVESVAALLDLLDILMTDLLGFSLGGIMAMHTAFRHAKYISQLVVVPSPRPRNPMHHKIPTEVRACLVGQMEGLLPLDASSRSRCAGWGVAKRPRYRM
jgi:pimeloyl-ACP methyl ester carboxylesterase